MKRRTFIAVTGVTGLGVQTGLAATGQAVFSNSPWVVFPGIDSEVFTHFQQFSKELQTAFSSVDGTTKLAVKTVTPKKIISQKIKGSGYHLVFKNALGNYIRMEKKGKDLVTGVYTELPS